MSKLNKILQDIEYYKSYDVNKSVKERLDKSLFRYVETVNHSFSRLKCDNVVTVAKRLNK